MKTTAKVFTIIGGILVVGGLLLAILGFSFGGLNAKNHRNGSGYIKETKSYDVSEVNQIETDLDNRKITILSTNNDKINMTYYTKENDRMISSQHGKNVTLKSEHAENWYDYIFNFEFLSFSFDSINYNEVVIEIPSSYQDELVLKTSNSSIELADFKKLSSLECVTSNSKVLARDINCKNAYFKSTNGRIELTNIISDGKITADTSNAKVTLSSCKANEMEIKTTNNQIFLDNVVADKSITSATSNGKIELLNLVSDDIYLKSSNAKIEGTIKGNQEEYNITTKTSDSNSSLPSNKDGTTNKSLFAKTSNARIDIEFVGNR